MDRWVTPPKRVALPIWGTPPSCKQALRDYIVNLTQNHASTIFIQLTDLHEVTAHTIDAIATNNKIYTNNEDIADQFNKHLLM